MPTEKTAPTAPGGIALIVPALDEEANLRRWLPYLTPLYRVIVVDNGSRDGSFETARQLGAETLHCPIKGYGRAVWTGIHHLAGSLAPPAVVVVFDADGTSPFEEIPRLVRSIIEGGNDFAIGQRSAVQAGAMPLHAAWGNALTVRLIALLAGYRYSEMGSLRAIRFPALLALEMRDRTWGWNVEMQVKAALRKLRIAEIPIAYRRRVTGRSKISGSLIGSLRAGFRILYAVFDYAARERWHLWRCQKSIRSPGARLSEFS